MKGLLKKILNLIKQTFKKENYAEEEEELDDIMYAAVELHPLADEYSLPDDYLPETFYVIKYYRGNEIVGIEPYSERKVKKLQKVMPVVFKVRKTLADKFMMESLIRFEM